MEQPSALEEVIIDIDANQLTRILEETQAGLSRLTVDSSSINWAHQITSSSLATFSFPSDDELDPDSKIHKSWKAFKGPVPGFHWIHFCAYHRQLEACMEPFTLADSQGNSYPYPTMLIVIDETFNVQALKPSHPSYWQATESHDQDHDCYRDRLDLLIAHPHINSNGFVGIGCNAASFSGLGEVHGLRAGSLRDAPLLIRRQPLLTGN